MPQIPEDEGVLSLEDLCLDSLASKVQVFLDLEERDRNFHPFFDPMPPKKKLRSTPNDQTKKQPIPQNLSNKLWQKLKQENLLHSASVQLFDKKSVNLSMAEFDGDWAIEKDLTVLCDHSISELGVLDMRSTDGICLEKYLSPKTKLTLIYLNLSGTELACSSQTALGELKALQTLILIETNFDDSGLKAISGQLPCLGYLDLSASQITKLTPLLLMRNHLRSLLLHNLKLDDAAAVSTLMMMDSLEFLDLSEATRIGAPEPNSKPGFRLELIETAVNAEFLPKLRILDFSGASDRFTGKALNDFLSSHPAIGFLGLLLTDACRLPAVKSLKIEVAGEGTAEQKISALLCFRRRRNRLFFCSRAIFNVFELLRGYDLLSGQQLNEIFKGVVEALEFFLEELAIQIAGSACLYNLCRNYRSDRFSPGELRTVILRCLAAIQKFPTSLQLHKNIWLTLCNDRILHCGSYNMSRCCSVALESMVLCADETVTRLTIAIVSILAAKIPLEDSGSLGSQEKYMKFMLETLETKLNGVVDVQSPDVTLKFTLSALWNLTDESAATSAQFLQQNGLNVVLRVLDKLPIPTIQTKVLGLLNNVAEVGHLRHSLMADNCIRKMLELLNSDRIEVSYFAAGILAHLCMNTNWPQLSQRKNCLDALGSRVEGWGKPDTEMVAYRSFRPFFPLLGRSDLPAVQLWAVWAIRHVCGKQDKRYLEMFVQEKGVNKIEELMSQCKSGSLVEKICLDILAMIRENAAGKAYRI